MAVGDLILLETLRRCEPSKACQMCGYVKGLSFFNKRIASKDGRSYVCRGCQHDYHRRHYETHTEYRQRMKERAARWNFERNASKRQRTAEARAALRERKREWALANPEKVRANRRNQHYKRAYGITYVEYIERAKAQNFCCAACGEKQDMDSSRTQLHVDHCHKTGQVRDLLCFRCNIALGSMRDSVEIGLRLVSYLEKWKEAA